MIIVKLQGGLGNQLFQYAFGRALQRRWDMPLKLDVAALAPSGAGGATPRAYALGALNVEAPLAHALEGRAFPRSRSGVRGALVDVALAHVARRHRITEPAQGFHGFPVKPRKGAVLLDGYWQSSRYFDGHAETIRRELTLRHPWSSDAERLAERMRASPSVAVHVRRGDYVSLKAAAETHGVCDPAYYRAACARIAERTEGLRAFVFSDDTAWCAEHLPLPVPTEIVPETLAGPHGCWHLMLMRRGAHFVLSNSTFGWWGAWLGEQPGSVVIAPDPWFRDARLRNDDLLPGHWQTLASGVRA